MSTPRIVRIVLVLASLVACQAVVAQDQAGSADSPLISRYQGSRLLYQHIDDFVRVALPTAYDTPSGAAPTAPVEGRREQRVYVAPKGRGALEVQRNYVGALQRAGASRILECDGEAACAGSAHRLARTYLDAVPRNNSVAFNALISQENHHALYKLARGGVVTYVTVVTTGGQSDGVGTMLDILSVKPMQDNLVRVADAGAIGKGLQAEGRIALYGVHFDTGRADVQPDSKAQLAEMAKVLQAQPQLKVFIVGHTDNQGGYDDNVALSMRRAQAIVQALSHDYGVAPGRLRPLGLSSAAPVATNATEAGRALNRRVELVVQ